MEKDVIDMAAPKAKGSVKEAIGKLTGDAVVECEGAAEKAKAQRPAAKK